MEPIEKMSRESTSIAQADVDAAKAAGWSDERLAEFGYAPPEA